MFVERASECAGGQPLHLSEVGTLKEQKSSHPQSGGIKDNLQDPKLVWEAGEEDNTKHKAIQ